MKPVVLLGLVIGLLAFGGSTLRAQEGGDWTAPYRPALLPDFVGDMLDFPDAPRYTIDMALEVTGERATITGHQSVHYTNRTVTPLDEIVFRLYPNLESYGGAMNVDHLTADGVAAATRLDETRSVLTVALPEPLASGDSITLEMDFRVTVIAGSDPLYAQFSYLDGVLALPNAYPVLSVYEPGSGWWQVTAHPQGDAVYSETAFYQVNITAPPSLIVITSGSESDITAHADGTITHHVVAPLMRDFALFAGEDYVGLSGEQDGVTINLYYRPGLPGSAEAARAGLRMTQDAVRIYNAAYGRYPFAELDVVQTPTTAGGIEYPGVFVVAANIWDVEEGFFEFVIAHETAHQWWYSLVGNDQTLDPWMDEALAQYSVAVYIRDLEGRGAYASALQSFADQYVTYVGATGSDQVIGLPVSEYPERAYFYMIYQKGPLFFAFLAEEYGSNQALAMLQDYFDAYRYRIAEPDDMLFSFEKTLGVELDSYFEEWVGEIPVG